jgi:hypothetical protein
MTTNHTKRRKEKHIRKYELFAEALDEIEAADCCDSRW